MGTAYVIVGEHWGRAWKKPIQFGNCAANASVARLAARFDVACITGPRHQSFRSATVVATTDLVCYGLTFWEFRPLVERNGAIAWKLLQALAKRLRAAEQG